LSGYEELANDEADNTVTVTEENTTVRDDTTGGGDYTPRPRSRGNDTTGSVSRVEDESSDFQHHREDESALSDDGGTLTGSTPRPPATKSLSAKPQFAGLGSPYEVLRREMKKKETTGTSSSAPAGNNAGADDDGEEDDTELLFQQHTARLPDMSMTPRSSLAPGTSDSRLDDSVFLLAGARPKAQDPLMHRVLDKNYRLMATPLKGHSAAPGVSPIRWRVTEKKKGDNDTAVLHKGKEKDNAAAAKPIWADSPMSSPEIAMPKLRSEAFMSPVRPSAYRNRLAAPRTPGVSVQTPAMGRKTRDVYAGRDKTPVTGGGGEKETDEITWESSGEEDEDIYGGMSPPKTINFALPPSKLLQTPGKFVSFWRCRGDLANGGD
jgi:DASH complex subunit ASK1